MATEPVSERLRQWRYLLAAFASTFLLVDFFASTKMPARKLLVHICQYVFASVLFCQYTLASVFFCQPYLLVYFASDFLLAIFLPAIFASYICQWLRSSVSLKVFHFWPQNGTYPLSTLNLLFHESDNFLQSPFSQNNLVQFILHFHRTLLTVEFSLFMVNGI